MNRRKRILAILDVNPFPATDGKTYPIEGQLTGLAKGWDIDILEVHRSAVKPGFETETHREIAQQVFKLEALPACSVWKRLGDEILFGKPYFIEPTVPVSKFKSLLAGQHYDVIYTSPNVLTEWVVAAAEALEKRPKLALNLNDSVTDRFRRDFDLFRMGVLSKKTSCKHFLQSLRVSYMATLERRMLKPFDVVFVQTQKDIEAIEKDCGTEIASKLVLAPNGIKESLLKLPYEQADQKRLLHIGALSRNRGELVFWFLDNVFNKVREEIPGLTIQLAGKVAEKDKQRLSEMPGVEQLGFVDDLDAVLGNATMSIAPLFMRSGLVNKMLDSMAAGVPCSGTRVFNGFPGFINGVHGFDVGSAKEWRDVLIDSLNDPAKLQRVSHSARELVQQNLRWEQTNKGINAALERIVEEPKSGCHAKAPSNLDRQVLQKV